MKIDKKIAVFYKDVKNFESNVIKAYIDFENTRYSRDECRKKIETLFNKISYKGYALVDSLPEEGMGIAIKKKFRELLKGILSESKLGMRAQNKPRGYPGDYKMIEFIYNNKPLSKGVGYFLDLYLLKNPYVIAVRGRKDKMREILDNFIRTAPASVIKILNLGCGGCREIREIEPLFIKKIVTKKKVLFNLIDQDNEALKFSHYHLHKTFNDFLSFKFYSQNIVNMITHKKSFLQLLGKQNMIYTIGVTDYLPDSIFIPLISFCLDMLSPRGEFIFAHKDRDAYNPAPIDWFCDWRFYPRNEKYILQIIRNLNLKKIHLKVEREPSGNIIFFTLTKNK